MVARFYVSRPLDEDDDEDDEPRSADDRAAHTPAVSATVRERPTAPLPGLPLERTHSGAWRYTGRR